MNCCTHQNQTKKENNNEKNWTPENKNMSASNKKQVSLASFFSSLFSLKVFTFYPSLSLSFPLSNSFWLWFSRLFSLRSIPLVYYYYLFMLLHRINFIPISIYLFQRVRFIRGATPTVLKFIFQLLYSISCVSLFSVCVHLCPRLFLFFWIVYSSYLSFCTSFTHC